LKKESDIKTLDDIVLIKKYQSTNDIEIVGILYLRYSHLIYGLCLKYLKDRENSKDASLEIFELLVVKLRSHDIKFFKSWLYILSKNHCLMKLRKENRNLINEYKETSHEEDHSSFNLELKLLKERKLNALESAIDQLKPKQAKCIKLFYLKGKSYDEIADLINEGNKAVKSYIQNGKRNLKLILQNHVFEQ